MNFPDLRTVTRRITRSLTAASSHSDRDTTSLYTHSDTRTHTPTHLACRPEPHSFLRWPCPAHAECVMSGAWVRLRQILYGVGGLASLWASVLWQSSLTHWIPTVNLLSFVRLFYSTLLMYFKANTHHPLGGVGVSFFENPKTVNYKEACWDDGRERIRGSGKNEN